jgi:LacI family transcriptional regulator
LRFRKHSEYTGKDVTTIYDIALEAGVSISTVSRVLNNPDKVHVKTRKKIQDIVRRYSYVPNAIARGLVRNSLKAIGILTSDILNYYFSNIASTLEHLFFNWGYSAILCNTGNKSEKKKDYIHILAEKKIDGLILVGSVFTGIEIEATIKQYMPNTPIVVANSSLDLPNVHYVLIDHDHGLDLAVCHLKERGHSRIGFVNTSTTYNSRRKVQGFYRAMEKNGFPSGEDSVINASFGLEGANKVIDEITGAGRDITALIFADDNSAFCALRRLGEKGFSVPADMAVIGYDNSFYSLYAAPPLTSIDTRSETFATLVANMLHDLLEGKEVGSSVILTPGIVVRSST